MKIAYIFPSRERPEKFFNTIDTIKCFSESDNYFVWAKMDDNDPAAEKYKERLSEYPEVSVVWGESKNKVDAINRGLGNIPPFDILCLHSDDMFFNSYGFDNDIREAFKEFNGLVHFPDGHVNERLITYPMMHREYYKSLGYIYHPDFLNVYCDNFQMLQAQMLGKYKFVNKKILEHRHPIWGFGQADELLKRTENPEGYKKDHETFLRLKQEHGW